jgi:hypothetical protein
MLHTLIQKTSAASLSARHLALLRLVCWQHKGAPSHGSQADQLVGWIVQVPAFSVPWFGNKLILCWSLGKTNFIIIIPSSHSINAIGPTPLRSGNKREHCSRMLATIAQDLLHQHAAMCLLHWNSRQLQFGSNVLPATVL